ncbi:MAG: bifunctional phosphoribosyl-AMP cyclohydrolase/phosphoribosyl-ATP diphosphatase HisIE [Xylanivirga thermophila]|jgi:imidazole glycerol-phosphate synthase subunit HisF|uniref:imidazole glycerol phosphate synthase subunit HisF n=1 Tax=Xylanivirga thermophila TaxID=2496273 RepID=UPI00101CE683|nr:imidazole glycerol phosphate synthase subunit HisF [Xylanivirga thermophila]
MKNIKVIPCLDIKNGRVVKGVNFQNIVDTGDPVDFAKHYEKQGADEIVLLDISASNEQRYANINLLKKIRSNISIPIIIGGGISSMADARMLFKAGADKISINSAAVDDPKLISYISDEFGKEHLIVAIDSKAKPNGSGWNVYTRGGTINTGLDVLEWAKEIESLGAGAILLTSMDRDGTKEGYDISLIKTVASNIKIPVIASGGAGKMEDFRDAMLDAQAQGLLAASLFHFNEINIATLKAYLNTWQGLCNIKFNEKGFLPAIIQDIGTNNVLMLAYMNKESLDNTIQTGKTWFWSRSRQKLWMKGETSGHVQHVKEIYLDCDSDTLLIKVKQAGAACHTGNTSCFYQLVYNESQQVNLNNNIFILGELYNIIINRKNNPKEGSYTNYLFDKGIDKILKKVGEESAEVIIAAKGGRKNEIIYEISDLVYHLLVLMVDKGIKLDDISRQLKKRR